MIIFDHVSKSYGTTNALDQITLAIRPGEFVFILGPSGAGKTSLARLLIKEITPTEGTIQVGDFDLTSLKKKEIPLLRQQIGVIFQDYKLLPDRTAAENIALSLEILNKTDEAVVKTVGELLNVAGLTDKGNLFPSQLSGGEAQRVVIARALGTDPAVLFADEPTGNLDQKNAWGIVDLLDRINKHGTTVIMATHDDDMANRLRKRVVRLENGKVVNDNAPVKIPTQANLTSETVEK
ncbi:cell division ATP-binding protein FtsE [Microgenomates group bacterium RBG_16_45_19]|nr:MAG: cell division ATP-binding protein FtsE [Microgenomates group bacterium RBG_16_45_19]